MKCSIRRGVGNTDTHLHHLRKSSAVRHLQERQTTTQHVTQVVLQLPDDCNVTVGVMGQTHSYLEQGSHGGVHSGVTLHLQNTQTHTHCLQ